VATGCQGVLAEETARFRASANVLRRWGTHRKWTLTRQDRVWRGVPNRSV